MDLAVLNEIILKGEDSFNQFKKEITNSDSLASELIAFSNGEGGLIVVGVGDNGSITGLSTEAVNRLNQLISNVSSQHVSPPINPITETVLTENGTVMLIKVFTGINKPYHDNNGVYWVKSGADKRKVTSREEIQRLFQRSGLLQADEIPVPNTSIADIDIPYFNYFLTKKFNKVLDDLDISLEQLLRNMKLIYDDKLTLTAVLLFTKNPENIKPIFIVKACFFNSNDINTSVYTDSRDIVGKLSDVLDKTVNFLVANIRHVQGDQGFNGAGIPEINPDAIKEIVANALIHRDYFISAPIKVFIFRNRVEVISPGHLPNSLTIDNIKNGTSVARNSLLASYGYYVIPYKGIGSGICRAINLHQDIEFVDDKEGNFFKVIFHRKEIET